MTADWFLLSELPKVATTENTTSSSALRLQLNTFAEPAVVSTLHGIQHYRLVRRCTDRSARQVSQAARWLEVPAPLVTPLEVQASCALRETKRIPETPAEAECCCNSPVRSCNAHRFTAMIVKQRIARTTPDISPRRSRRRLDSRQPLSLVSSCLHGRPSVRSSRCGARTTVATVNTARSTASIR